ncbi:hypothetical protein J2W42_006698 [Rhizobium tibeticum]|uniref:hypothetical protein n=1 Tax=Rhizobium tibeticum TaxID=501024 RepID=UPI002789B05E|nr:hypothetical protein [Rhizobium tibeticum]MDP9813822.1 hypothetical protein [Rhizobium tibeticum]
MKPVSDVEVLALLRFSGVSAIEYIQDDDGRADLLRNPGNPLEAIGEKNAAVSTASKSFVATDHGDVRGRDRAVARTIASEFSRQFVVINRMSIDCVEADDRLLVLRRQHPNTKIICLRELVGRLPDEVIDLANATRKSRPIVFGRIERLDDKLRFYGFCHYLEMTVSR